MRFEKRILAMGAGASVGAIMSPVLKKYVEPMIGTQVPYLNTLGVWGTYHVFVPLVTGAASLVITQFTDWISRKHAFINDSLAMYGFAALFSSLITGFVESTPGAGLRMSTNRQIVRSAAVTPVLGNGMQTPTGISNKTIVA